MSICHSLASFDIMKTCEGFSHLLLLWIFTTFLPAPSQVTGYVGHNVTLPCRTDFSNVTQSQWEFLSPDGNKTLIMVSSKQHGKTVHESHLKGRVDMEDQSLIIKNVELSDAGSYICTVTSFPDGPSQKNIYLHLKVPLRSSFDLFLKVLNSLLYHFLQKSKDVPFSRT
uniref:Ig-like domain-containing protein n=1 Tax=Oryzias melastigma TaxID=30732 RepID=A0A3B3DP50_ORYME